MIFRTQFRSCMLLVSLILAGCATNVFNPANGAKTDGLDSEGYTLEGERLLREGDFNGASDAFAKAIDLDAKAGYPRLGYAKANFDRWDFSQAKVIEMFYSDSGQSQENQFNALVELFQPAKWPLERVDSLYAPISTAVDVLSPMFAKRFTSSDDFDPLWIGADFSILLSFHAFIGLLDYNGDGRITDPEDNPFAGISIDLSADDLTIQGLTDILNDSDRLAVWEQKAAQSIDEVETALAVYTETFGDSTGSLGEVDSLLTDLETALQVHVAEGGAQ